MQAALSQALTLESQGRLVEADQLYRSILKTEPQNGMAMYRRAVLASQRDEHKEAVRLLQSALKHVPPNIRARVNNDFSVIMRKNGTFAFEQCRMKDAVELLVAAIGFNPDDADAHFSEAVCRLTAGDYVNGWPKYGWRWRAYGDEPYGAGVAQAVWTGQPLEGKSILVTHEQGFGDTVMFSRRQSHGCRSGALARDYRHAGSRRRSRAARRPDCAPRLSMQHARPAHIFENRSFDHSGERALPAPDRELR